jgi:hypothetical protein
MNKLSIIFFAAITVGLTACASAPESGLPGDREATPPQAQQSQPQEVQQPQAETPEGPSSSQQQAATLANPANDAEQSDAGDAGDATLVSVMPRDQWLQNLKDVLSSELCSEDEIFRSCYPVSETECRQHIQAITASCANRYQAWIPEELHDTDRQSWDKQVGECTGGAMSSLLDAVYPVNDAQTCQQKLDSST